MSTRAIPVLLLCMLTVAPVRSWAEEPAEPAADPAAAARAALDSWKYEDAAEALARLAKSAPADARLPALRIEFLARIGSFPEAAELAKGADVGLAEKLPLDVALKVGRSLVAAGQEAAGRRWILAAARRAGPGQTERFADSLAALLAPRG
jgi:predicted Zn-dependent protease